MEKTVLGGGAGHTYYRCSRKSKITKCTEPFIREEELDRQLSSIVQKFFLPEDWTHQMLAMLEKDEQTAIQSSASAVQGTRAKIQDISTKLQRLLDSYLDQVIDRDVFENKKIILVHEKKKFEEEIHNLEHQQISWVEPMRD